jgi:UDP-3-O-[3-hydroxymyristoyl] N-acetylglucosamine deacetylase
VYPGGHRSRLGENWGDFLPRQRTLAGKVSCTGLGLHSGAPVRLTLRPARANTGIVFVRADMPEAGEIRMRPASVRSTAHATTLGDPSDPDASISTVEHLLAAVTAFEIDNLRIEVEGPEVPVMDGSAGSFVYLLRSAGVLEQEEPRAVLRIRRPIEVRDGLRRIRVEPARRLRIQYAVDFEHPAIGRQELKLPRIDAEIFERELAPARTFGFLRDVEMLLRAGLARGGSLENAVVLDAESVVNPSGLRWPDEFVRHKVLDLLGDLALLGLRLQGFVRVERGGHGLHHRLVQEILRCPDAWRVVGGPAIPQLDLVPAPA